MYPSVYLPSQSSILVWLCRLCRGEAKEGTGHMAANGNDLLTGSNEVAKQDAAAVLADQAAAPPGSSSTLPSKSGAAEADASGSLGRSSATSSTAASDTSSSHASNFKANDATPAQPQTRNESATADVQQADSTCGGDGSQLSHATPADQASSRETGSNASSPVAKSSGLASTSAGADGSNGEHGDDDARSMRSQDTTTSRASKIQASEMSRLQV